ncbi:MAG: large conductance mechanosensitive channel protein MscL, partial [Mollicutes bacterium]|nr:large conductance mechanosensitive channel protein MscL [Mollicutes bacterium]
MIKEFKSFISKGNVLDLAVGVIIGGAFGKIVTSLVNDVVMPLLGIILGGVNFSSLYLKVNDSILMYGDFIQSTIDFLLIALCIFFMIKLINKFKKPAKNVKEEVNK